MYLLNEFGRTVGAKDKKDRKKRAFQIAGALAGTALLGAAAYKNKGKIGQLFKKKVVTNVTKETPKPMLALPAAGQSSSLANKVKNELDDLFVETSKRIRRTNPSRNNLNELDNLESRVLTTPANMTKREINTSKVLARKEALKNNIRELKNNRDNVKQSIEDVTDSKLMAKGRTDMPLKTRARVVKDSKRELKRDKVALQESKRKAKEKVDQLRKSNPSLYHLNKLIEFNKLCTY